MHAAEGGVGWGVVKVRTREEGRRDAQGSDDRARLFQGGCLTGAGASALFAVRHLKCVSDHMPPSTARVSPGQPALTQEL